MTISRIGLDLAKNVFELYGVGEDEREVLARIVWRDYPRGGWIRQTGAFAGTSETAENPTLVA